MGRIVLGILAHVDAGKTTLSEAILYKSGNIKSFGRVDHGDSFLDNNVIERERGITIFSKQAEICTRELELTLLDTPGHVDFSAEMERTLSVLDYAILVISAADGVQSHTRTLWNLLNMYHIPTIIFINKMDMPGASKDLIMTDLNQKLSESCIDFSYDNHNMYEQCAMCDDNLFDLYLDNGIIEDDAIASHIRGRRIFPCLFGSALRLEGIYELLDTFKRYFRNEYTDKENELLSARVFKVSLDEQNNRLTYIKILSGILKVKDVVKLERGIEKVNQIRIYSGENYKIVDSVYPGMICAVKGLSGLKPMDCIGNAKSINSYSSEAIMEYRVVLPIGADTFAFYKMIKDLADEEPGLNIKWNDESREIRMNLMGSVQMEIVKRICLDRFKLKISFDRGRILYRETISSKVLGIGHFEPLRHYAEVHLLIEPLPEGSGLEFANDCSDDVLDKNWQKLIISNLEGYNHPGVMTGSPITDMRITLKAGRANVKHTESTDFRMAALRAVRQGLMTAESILLEPYYNFKLEIPQKMVGRAMTDINKMSGSFEGPITDNDKAILTGLIPVSEIDDYQIEVSSYTHGLGTFSSTFSGYKPCHNTDEIISSINYDSESDLNNPSSSVFCSHGSGYIVPWYEVPKMAHIPTDYLDEKIDYSFTDIETASIKKMGNNTGTDYVSDTDLEIIFNSTYQSHSKYIRKKFNHSVVQQNSLEENSTVIRNTHRSNMSLPKRLVIDGYNLIFAWEELATLAKSNIDAARDKLVDIISNYQGYVEIAVVIVFDAYKVIGGRGSNITISNVNVIYTKEGETADMYIERMVHDYRRQYYHTVVTSDGLEQLTVTGQGAAVISSREFIQEIKSVTGSA